MDAGEHNVMPMNTGSLSVLFIDDHQYLFTTRHHNGDEDGIIQNNQIHRHSMLHCKKTNVVVTVRNGAVSDNKELLRTYDGFTYLSGV